MTDTKHGLANLPEDLTRNRRWAVYRLEPKDGGGYNKKPRRANLTAMKWSNPEEWLTYEAALTTYRAKDACDGIGYFLGCGIWGIDIDGCIVDGKPNAEALEIIEGMNSYTEVSPSGTGVHILFRVSGYTLRGKNRRNDQRGLELYDGEDSPRFFTVTGKPLPGYETIRDASKAVATFYDAYMATRDKPVTSPVVATDTRATDDQLIEWMTDIYPKSAALWRGDYSAYTRPAKDRNGNVTGYEPDHSRADLALCTYLVRVCHGDTDRADQLFRRSGLYRDKWDEMHGNQTYGAISLETAARDYNPAIAPNFEAWAIKNDQTLQSAYDSFTANHAPHEATKRRGAAENYKSGIDTPKNGERPADGARMALASVSDFMAEKYDAAVQRFKDASDCKTGWANLDRQITSLYPGLYILGAPPGAGKTTWAWQLADQLATSGRKCIYVTLEQTAFEMVSKSIARRAFLYSDDLNSPAAVDIRRGTKTSYTDKARAVFTAEAAPNLYVYEGNFGTTIEDLTEYLDKAVTELTEKKDGKTVRPVVFIDYLQVLRARDPRIDAQETVRTKHVTEGIKSLQRFDGLTVFVITAYSRDAYDRKTSISSSRDTSGIEYTADAVFGLDFAFMHEPKPEDFISWENERDKAMKETPRRIMLTCVKSRYYPPFKNAFRYHSKQDTYTEYTGVDDPDFRLWERELTQDDTGDGSIELR